jgi:DNA-binding transcriptional regulator GbsR (MarR family)
LDALKDQLNSDVDKLAEKIGEFIRYWGFKKIHGKLWCLLFLSEEPLDASQLIEKTGVSKALMSQTLAELLEYRVVVVLDDTKKRKQYVTNKNILSVITSVLRQREQLILGDIMLNFRKVDGFNEEQLKVVGINPQNLHQLGRMISFAERFLTSMLRFESISFRAFKKIFD